MEVKYGIIKAIVFKGKYGFIYQEDGTDIFFHLVGVVKPAFDELREGMSVKYFVTTSEKGIRAIGVIQV